MSNPLRLIELLDNVEQVQVEKESEEFKKGFSLCKQFVYIHLSKNKDIFNLSIVNKELEKENDKLQTQIKLLNTKVERYSSQQESNIENLSKKDFKKDLAQNIRGLINKKSPTTSLEAIELLILKWLIK